MNGLILGDSFSNRRNTVDNCIRNHHNINQAISIDDQSKNDDKENVRNDYLTEFL